MEVAPLLHVSCDGYKKMKIPPFNLRNYIGLVDVNNVKQQPKFLKETLRQVWSPKEAFGIDFNANAWQNIL